MDKNTLLAVLEEWQRPYHNGQVDFISRLLDMIDACLSAPSVPEQAGTVNSPVAEKSANGIEWRTANTKDLLPISTKLYALPEGYCIVPIEPTTAMIDAADKLWNTPPFVARSFTDIYKAMLSASPMNVPPLSTTHEPDCDAVQTAGRCTCAEPD